jgi:hypothetical protein
MSEYPFLDVFINDWPGTIFLEKYGISKTNISRIFEFEEAQVYIKKDVKISKPLEDKLRIISEEFILTRI